MIETIETAVVIPNNPADQKKINDVLEYISNIKHGIAVKNLEIKENVEAIVKEYNIPKNLVNRMVKTYHKESFQKDSAIDEVFSVLYETITKQKSE